MIEWLITITITITTITTTTTTTTTTLKVITTTIRITKTITNKNKNKIEEKLHSNHTGLRSYIYRPKFSESVESARRARSLQFQHARQRMSVPVFQTYTRFHGIMMQTYVMKATSLRYVH